MKIEIITREFPGGWHPKQLEVFLGGNEETLVLFPRALAKADHEIVIYTDVAGCEEYKEEGITWQQRSTFDLEERKECLVTYKDQSPVFRNVQADKLIHWSVDVENQWSEATLNRLDHMIVLSSYHASRMEWAKEKHAIIPLGMEFPPAGNVVKDENLAVYASSPDRGLTTLLQDWAAIKSHRPKLKLVVTYSWSGLKKWGGPSGQAFAQQLEAMMNQPDISRAELNREQMTGLLEAAQYYIFPLNRPDSDLCGFGLQKAIHAGCIPVLNYAQGNGFQDVTKEYIPYREFLHGSDSKIDNPGHCHNPMGWDEIVVKYWEPMLYGESTTAAQEVA